MGAKMSYQHKEMSNGRWAEMSLCEQMANIGSEISRAFNWRNKGKEEFSLKAFDRALELLDLTAACTVQYTRLKEILRTREALVDYFYGDNIFSSSEEQWRKYFDGYVYCLNNKIA